MLFFFSPVQSHWAYRPHLRVDSKPSGRWPTQTKLSGISRNILSRIILFGHFFFFLILTGCLLVYYCSSFCGFICVCLRVCYFLCFFFVLYLIFWFICILFCFFEKKERRHGVGWEERKKKGNGEGKPRSEYIVWKIYFQQKIKLQYALLLWAGSLMLLILPLLTGALTAGRSESCSVSKNERYGDGVHWPSSWAKRHLPFLHLWDVLALLHIKRTDTIYKQSSIAFPVFQSSPVSIQGSAVEPARISLEWAWSLHCESCYGAPRSRCH